MNRKYIIALLALICALSGCSSTKERLPNEQSSQSVSSSTVSTSNSSSSESSFVSSGESSTTASVESSTVSTSSTSEISSSASSTTTSSTSSSVPSSTSGDTEFPNDIELTIIKKDEVLTVANGEVLNIGNGEHLDIRGTLIIENGATVNVKNYGVLLVSGNVELNGTLTLNKGGKLIMEDNNASVKGAGDVSVKDSFDQIDSEHGIIYSHITPPERVVTNGVTTVGGVVIANKAIKLPPEYGSWLSNGEVESVAYNALKEMNNNSPHRYSIVSAYRSYDSQKKIFQGWVNIYGFEEASRISSQAGHSEHQTGLTMDLDSLEEYYANTPEGKWLAQNCWKYGFIIRYPNGKEDITGYSYEPWHVRYLGKSTASLVYHSGLTLEEFLNVEGGTVVID